jgi:hypothetical protein
MRKTKKFRGATNKGWILPVRHRTVRMLVFTLAVVTVFLIPNSETKIVRVVECAGLVMILTRGLVAYYHDFLDAVAQQGRKPDD